MTIQKSFLILSGTVWLAYAGDARADVYVPPQWQNPPMQQQSPALQQQSGQAPPSASCDCAGACAPPAAYAPPAVYVPQPVYIMLPQPPPPPREIIAEADRTVYFGFDKSNLTGESRNRLDTLAERLMSADDVTGARIVGYADRIGTTSYNMWLSRKRAENVRAYLVSRGFIKPSIAETRWVGKSEPSTSCSKYLPRAQLLNCLQPDRKVQVDIDYRAEVQAER
jgi:outer membrane protein OmpA-like peptidoglycan-associated protein